MAQLLYRFYLKLSSCLCVKRTPVRGGMPSLDIILEHPKPGGTRSLNCLVALSPPKITIGVLSGVINFGSKSLSALHHPYAISKISDVHLRVKFVFLGRYKVCAIPEKTFFDRCVLYSSIACHFKISRK